MYRNVYYDQKEEEIHVWDDVKGHFTLGYQPYGYILDKAGEFITIDGHKCKKINGWSKEAIDMGIVYEHDVPATTRTLIDLYGDSDELSVGCKTLFLDIEVEKGEKYSTAEAATNPITAITYFVTGDKNFTCLLVDSKSKKVSVKDKEIEIKEGVTVKADIITFGTEFDLLRYFVSHYQSFEHSIITGWNVEFFDMPYMFNRLVNVMGWSWAIQLSPIKIVKRKFDDNYGQSIQIAGVSILDYLMLYKKFTYSEQPNYKLDTIAKIEIKVGKREYDGDLDQLYEQDIVKFAEYNIVDTWLIVALNDKLDYIDIARSLCHKGHTPYEDILYTSKYIDGSILTFCRRKKLIVSSNKAVTNAEQAVGAYVKLPTPGLYRWIYDLDLTSLYPMNIIGLNISQETKFGKIEQWDEDEFVKGTTRRYVIKLIVDESTVGQFDDVFVLPKNRGTVQLNGSEELMDYMKTNNLSISSNGILYDLKKPGIIPEILSIWFDERDNFNKLRSQFEKEGNTDQAVYYDKKQLVTKYLLNSVYGVLLMPSFRFYDKDNGEAVTTTGVKVIQWSGRMANFYYGKILNTTEDYVIYTDTDSTFLPLLPLLEHSNPNVEELSDEEIVELCVPIINEVQKFINRSFQKYGERYHNIQNHRWNIKQELIARRAMWTGAKKRYAQWLVSKKGHPVNEIDVKGMEVVRSNFPKAFRTFMKEVLTDILHDVQPEILNDKVRKFKKLVDTAPLSEVMSPTGVKEISKYETADDSIMKGTPIHVKSALNYNRLLKLASNTKLKPITDGDKIVWGYLKPNQYGFDTMALTITDNVQEDDIFRFMTKHIDRDKIFKQSLEGKLQQYWDVLGWGQIELNILGKKFFDFN